MVIECSKCHARYNVDEGKIPPSGVKVRCHKCQNIIVIQKTPAQPEPAPVLPETPITHPEPPPSPPTEPEAPDVSAPEPPSVPEPQIPEPAQPDIPQKEPPVAPGQADVSAPEETPSEPPEPDVPDVVPPEPEPPEPTPPAADEPPIQAPAAVEEPPAPPAVEMTEEDKKWNERARRLAKALASDLVLYNQDRVEEGIRNGTLADLLGPEIRRSWEYYCQQIPKHIVEKTDHFKDQLNKIVGKGKEIFK